MEKEIEYNKNLPHYGQILTTKASIEDYMWDISHPVDIITPYLLANGVDGQDNLIRLYSVCARVYFLSKLVYYNGSEIVKLSYKEYETGLFDPFLEDKNELRIRLEMHQDDLSSDGLSVTDELVDEVWNAFVILKALWCRFLSCLHEQVYIHEYAYALKYVFDHKGKLSMPDYRYASSIFPDNYEDYHNGEGIARYICKLMESSF